jgi:hypothetical protein
MVIGSCASVLNKRGRVDVDLLRTQQVHQPQFRCLANTESEVMVIM